MEHFFLKRERRERFANDYEWRRNDTGLRERSRSPRL
jgi:hypothetical protein